MLFRLFLLCSLIWTITGCTGIGTDTTPQQSDPTAAEPSFQQEKPTDPHPLTAQPDIGTLLVIGEAEYVYIGIDDIRLAARIDTGATTSSLDARKIKLYESDGKKWVRFQVVEPKSGKTTAFKRPLTRTAEIKRHGAEKQKRYVVKLPIKLGPIDREIEFTLTDRSLFEYPVLIGRNFLKGTAVVDVDRKYSISPLAEKQ